MQTTRDAVADRDIIILSVTFSGGKRGNKLLN